MRCHVRWIVQTRQSGVKTQAELADRLGFDARELSCFMAGKLLASCLGARSWSERAAETSRGAGTARQTGITLIQFIRIAYHHIRL